MKIAEFTVGWLKLYRSLLDNWLWKEKPFSKGQAWIDLMMIAESKETKIPYKGEIVVCKKGSINRSILSLSERWGWSREKTRLFLKTLESDGMISVEATTNRTTVTLLNYGKMQSSQPTNHTTKSQRTLQRADSEPYTDKEYKNTKNIYKRENAPPTLTEIISFVNSESLKINSEKFFYYYEAKNWKGISDWKSKAREWNQTEKTEQNHDNSSVTYDIDLFEKMLNED